MSELHPLVKALVAEIPAQGPWPVSKRALWLQAAASIFDLVYGKGEEISIEDFLDPGVKETAQDKQSAEPEMVQAEEPSAGANVGGRPKTTGPDRPKNIPTNHIMALRAIEANGGAAGARTILAYVRKTFWPEAPDAWTASLHDHVKAGKLARDGINFVAVKKAEEEKAPAPALEPSTAPVSKPSNVTMGLVKFEYGGKSVMVDKKQFRVAEALRRAMGQGHLDYKYLAGAGNGAPVSAAESKNLCAEMVASVRPWMEQVGLEIVHSPNYGYSMYTK